MMRKNIKWLVRRHLPTFRLLNYFRLLCTSKKSYLFRTGWVKSILKGYPCDEQGNELPWMNYSFIFFIRERLKDDMALLEFGGGYSTIFWAKYVKKVYVVEHDVFFSEMLKDKSPTNVQTFLTFLNNDVPYSEHAKIVSEKNDDILFDIIVIDGIDRVDCCIKSMDYLKNDGVIIWDDSIRIEYFKGFEYLYKRGFKKLEFEGIKPGDRGVDRAAIFYREKNSLNI